MLACCFFYLPIRLNLAISLTFLYLLTEQQRIKDAGGFIARSRVLGILAVTRSFGDHGMKDFVTAVPYVSITSLGQCGDCPFLILACDGVWDVLTGLASFFLHFRFLLTFINLHLLCLIRS